MKTTFRASLLISCKYTHDVHLREARRDLLEVLDSGADVVVAQKERMEVLKINTTQPNDTKQTASKGTD